MIDVFVFRKNQKPLNRLEDILQKLLVEATSGVDGARLLSPSDREKVFATAGMRDTDQSSIVLPLYLLQCTVELALTRASCSRLLTIIDTLLKCIQSSEGSSDSELSFPLPRTLLTLATKVRSFSMYPPHEDMLVDSWTVDNWPSEPVSAGQAPETMGSMVSNGQYLFIHGKHGLLKVGTGYHGTVKSKVYARNEEFHPNQHGCLVLLNEPRLVLLFRSKCIEPRCFVEIDTESLKQTASLEVGGSVLFKGSGGEMYDGQWLETYSPAFSNGKYLSVLRQLGGDKEDEADFEFVIDQFDPSNRYSFARCMRFACFVCVFVAR